MNFYFIFPVCLPGLACLKDVSCFVLFSARRNRPKVCAINLVSNEKKKYAMACQCHHNFISVKALLFLPACEGQT